MAYIRHELPQLAVRHIPRRHRGVTNTVPDVIENLTIRQGGNQGSQNGRPRIGTSPHLGFPAAVVRVADFALLPEQLAARGDIRDVLAQRIGHLFVGGGNAMAKQPRGHIRLEFGRLASPTRETRQNKKICGRSKDADYGDNETGNNARLSHPTPHLRLTPGAFRRPTLQLSPGIWVRGA